MKISVILFLFFTCLFHIQANGQATNHPSINGLYKFQGKLNNRIPVFLWFVVKDSVVSGEVTYLKTAKRIPITVAGEITKDEGLTLYEFTKSGYITGIYNGKLNTSALNGTWTKPGSQKEIKYALIPKDTILATNIDASLKPATITGEYVYRFGEKGSQGGIDIKQLDGDSYLVAIECVTASPAHNQAIVEATKVRMINNTIIYKVPYGDCRFKIRAFTNLIVIDWLGSNIANCGFGFNASIDGVFIKTSKETQF